jgi:hypothetical protein
VLLQAGAPAPESVPALVPVRFASKFENRFPVKGRPAAVLLGEHQGSDRLDFPGWVRGRHRLHRTSMGALPAGMW